MSLSAAHHCTCPRCGRPEPHPDQVLHQRINLLVSRLDEQQRRWFVALEAKRVGRGGETLLAQITGLDRRTIRRGRRELQAGLAERPSERVRPPAVGTPPVGRRIRSCCQFLRRCLPPKRPAIRWADAPKPSAVRCVT